MIDSGIVPLVIDGVLTTPPWTNRHSYFYYKGVLRSLVSRYHFMSMYKIMLNLLSGLSLSL